MAAWCAGHGPREGLVRRELEGRAYRYTPTRGGEDYAGEVMAWALAAGPDQVGAFVHFLSRMSPQEAQALVQAYQELDEKP